MSPSRWTAPLIVTAAVFSGLTMVSAETTRTEDVALSEVIFALDDDAQSLSTPESAEAVETTQESNVAR